MSKYFVCICFFLVKINIYLIKTFPSLWPFFYKFNEFHCRISKFDETFTQRLYYIGNCLHPGKSPVQNGRSDSTPRILTLNGVHTSLLSNWRSGYEKGDTQWGRDQGWTVIRAEECWHKSLGGHSTTTWTKFYPILTIPFSSRQYIMDILYNTFPLLNHGIKRGLSTDHLPISSCRRSYWMPLRSVDEGDSQSNWSWHPGLLKARPSKFLPAFRNTVVQRYNEILTSCTSFQQLISQLPSYLYISAGLLSFDCLKEV